MIGDRIPERDWKYFRQVRERALERFCLRVLDACRRLADDDTQTAHERYLAVYRLIEERDRDLARAFDGPSRSDAVLSLMLMRRMDLLTEDDIAGFSESVQEAVRSVEPRRPE
jgi:uncharacterized protein (UPF0262 family)